MVVYMFSYLLHGFKTVNKLQTEYLCIFIMCFFLQIKLSLYFLIGKNLRIPHGLMKLISA